MTPHACGPECRGEPHDAAAPSSEAPCNVESRHGHHCWRARGHGGPHQDKHGNPWTGGAPSPSEGETRDPIPRCQHGAPVWACNDAAPASREGETVEALLDAYGLERARWHVHPQEGEGVESAAARARLLAHVEGLRAALRAMLDAWPTLTFCRGRYFPEKYGPCRCKCCDLLSVIRSALSTGAASPPDATEEPRG